MAACEPLGQLPKFNKTCSRCGETKSDYDFNFRTKSLDGRQPWCRACFTEYQRLKKYDITVDQMNVMLARGCEVCGTHENLCIDHCHTTEIVRGALCDRHNRALCLLDDDPDLIMALHRYISRF